MGNKVSPALAKALGAAAAEGEVTCSDAEDVARALGLPPAEVGEAMDALGLRIVKCQLGLFGFGTSRHSGAVITAAPEVSADLEREIRAALVDGRMPCRAAWEIAERRGLGRIEVAEACEAMLIKIKPCQLGAF
ncbi:MAG: hypothetical protein M0R80_24705 [Proteobacteria bacterium]|jgi:hypothetical protein|nr:hypothetical protein [Pseudomonadota bacterium]